MNKKIKKEPGLSRTLVVPNNIISRIDSRSSCSTQVKIGSTTFDLPVLLSPMPFFGERAIRTVNNRFLTFIPRIKSDDRDYSSMKERTVLAKTLHNESFTVGVSVGLKDDIEDIINLTKYTEYLLIDTASGYNYKLHELIEEVRSRVSPDTIIISGNVISKEAKDNLLSLGCNFVRVGIGTSPNCSTSEATCIGRPVLGTLLSCELPGAIADGGIKSPHDLSLALLFSELAMCSSVFKYTQLNSLWNENKSTVPAYGCASSLAKGTSEYVEGVVTHGEKEDFESTYKKLKQGLQSSMSYLGARNMSEYRLSDFSLVHE